MNVLAQISLDLASIGKLGEVAIVSLAVIILSLVLLRVVRNMGEGDKADRGLLKQMIDLATSYKSESATREEAYRVEAAATRAVVQESNDMQRQNITALTKVVDATNVQTGEIRLLRGDFKNYQTLQNDTISLLADNIAKFETTMVAFGVKLDTAIDDIHNNAKDHQEITELVKKAIEEMLTAKKEILSAIGKLSPFPPSNVVTVNTGASPAPDAAKADAGDDSGLLKAG
jgi:hypothetical protein